jgi:hypothetical protein
MYLLLSGEGKTDIGRCMPSADCCEASQFEAGAMAIFIDQLIEQQLGYEYSHLDFKQVSFLSKAYLTNNRQSLKSRPKSMSLRGKKKFKETQYYYKNARTLAVAAKQKSIQVNDNVIAVLFRDADGTASAGRGMWQAKVNSMVKGFADEDYAELGLPMMPMPKSEAWLLCAVKDYPYQHCDLLEKESGNDDAPNPLKEQLDTALVKAEHQDTHVRLVKDRVIDVNQIEMPSLDDFKKRLSVTVKNAQKNAR